MNSSTSPRLIILVTLYRTENKENKHHLVTSYKTDPKGEESFGELSAIETYDLKTTFVNRVVTLTGIGTHIPLINSRMVLNAADSTLSFGYNLNPYPRSTDFANPYVRPISDGRQLRISLSSVELFNFTKRDNSTSLPSDEVLANIFGVLQVTRLPRRPKMQISTPETETKKKEKIQKNKETKAKELSSIEQKVEAAGPSKSKDADTIVIPGVITQDRSLSDRTTKVLTTFEKKRAAFLARCISLCTQNNLSQPDSLLETDRDSSLADKTFSRALDILLAGKPDAPLTDPSVEKLKEIKTVVALAGGRIIGISNTSYRVKGLELVENEIGFVLMSEQA